MADKTKVMAIVGSRKASEAMRQQAMAQANKALAAGWRISTGGAHGVDAAAIKAAVDAGKAKSLDIYLPEKIGNQNPSVRSLLKTAKEAGANVVEDAGQPAGSYAKACYNRDKVIVDKSDALVGLQNNASKGTKATVDAAAEKGIPVKKMSYAKGLLKNISRLNSVLLTINVLQVMEDYNEYKEKLKECSDLFEKWKKGEATEKDIEELEKCGIKLRSDLNWQDIDQNTVAPHVVSHGFSGRGNPYRDEQGRFCSESEAAMVIG